MPLRADDLPKHVRDRIQKSSRTPNTRSTATRTRQPYRCHACGQPFDDWNAAAERHTAETGHTRFDAILSRTPSS